MKDAAGFHAMRSLRRPLFVVWLALASGIALVLQSGCSAWQPEAARRTEAMPPVIAAELASRKAESFKVWESVVVGGRRLASALALGTPMIVSGSASLSIEVESPSPSEEFEGKPLGLQGSAITVKGKVGPAEGLGSAAVVSGDGYFLTAGHNILHYKSLVLIAIVSNECGVLQVRRAPVRVVWAPDDPAIDPDIAVVHADVGPLDAFEWVAAQPDDDAGIVTAGWPLTYLEMGSGGTRMSGGRILSITRWDGIRPSPSYSLVRHDAPIAPGDSGGPVLDGKGRLIGINSAVEWGIPIGQWLGIVLGVAPRHVNVREYAATAIMPDLDWLQKLIEDDRRRMNGDATSSVARPSPGLADSPR